MRLIGHFYRRKLLVCVYRAQTNSLMLNIPGMFGFLTDSVWALLCVSLDAGRYND